MPLFTAITDGVNAIWDAVVEAATIVGPYGLLALPVIVAAVVFTAARARG